jgi:hypothetical protein
VKLAATRDLHAYWNALRGARSAPERREIDPSAIRGVLADTFILEVDRRGRYPIRISGARTNCLFARELRGDAFVDLWRPNDRSEITAMLGSVAEQASAIVAGVSSNRNSAQPLELELLLLPLRHHGKTHARILGALFPVSLPSWIGLIPAGALNLLSLRVLGRADDETAAAIGFGRAPPLDRRSHLVVVRSVAL